MTTHSRRAFLQASLAGGAAASISALAPRAMARPRANTGKAAKSLNILILGGTGFIGPHIVEAAQARGHTMTLFNRGLTNPGLFPNVEKLKGDRDPKKDEGLAALAGRSWDAAVDTSGYYPRMVRSSAELLGDVVNQYVFISSISVYESFAQTNMEETAPLGKMEDETLEERGAQSQYYGPLKALCEQAATKAMGGNATNIRPGLIVGPRDNVPRFTYWPVRVELGGELLAPGSPDDPVQYIDARDLAEFVVTCLENKTMGDFNAAGPASPTNIAEMLYGCKAVTGGDASFTWVDAEFLAKNNVSPWGHMPVWVPPTEDMAGFGTINNEKAIAAGYTSRPLADTVRDTLEWYHNWPAGKPFPWRGGMMNELDREKEVLAAWQASKKGRAEVGASSD